MFQSDLGRRAESSENMYDQMHVEYNRERVVIHKPVYFVFFPFAVLPFADALVSAPAPRLALPFNSRC